MLEAHPYRDGVVEMKEVRCRAHGFQMVVKQPRESGSMSTWRAGDFVVISVKSLSGPAPGLSFTHLFNAGTDLCLQSSKV